MAEPNREFLARILPREGWKCAAAKPPDNGPLRHFWTRSTDELASIIEQWDAVGYTTYHACASFNTIEGSRKQNNVHALQAFWLDIDAGAGKPYPDQILALDALKRFAHAASMPEPLVVFSGQGLHAYWPLEEPITYADWKPRADALKALCREHNFGAGPERTGDAASLLRTPGSHHRKDPQNARLVTLHQWGVISSLDHLPLHNATDASGNPTSAKPAHFSSQDFSGRPRNVVPPSGGSGKTSGEQNIQNNDPSWLGGLEGPPADPDKVADQCRQIGYMREIRGDRMHEPLWHASIGVLAWCNEGREVSHEWSDGDDRYNENEVDARVDRVLALSGPTLCSRFEELNPDGCAGCPFAGKLSSPIQLGRGGPRIETTIASAPQVEAETLPILHEPFIWSVSLAILCRSEGMNGKIIDVLVCQYPVLVHAVNRGEINQQRHSVVLRYWRPHEGWAEAELPMKTLFGAHGGAEVAGLGIVVHDNDLWRRYLRQELDAMIAKEKAKVQFEQFGWKENDQAFLVGSRLYTSGAYTEIAGSPEVMLRARYLRPGGERRKGSLAAWKAAADRFGAPGNEAQMVALLMSFGAPLMRFFGEAEGGMVLSVVGAKTGGGKSTALNAATSVWGDRRGLEMVAIDTRVAKSATLAVACNLPVIFDEARERDPESLRDLVQMFTQGRDKLRGTAEGTLVHNSSQWQTILLCGSNKSLVDTIAAAKGSEAMNARILELTLPTLSKSVVDHSLEKQFNDNTGWAGEVYAQIIVNPANQDVIKKALVACASRLVTTYTLGSEHRFLVRGVSCMFVAANIVNSAGILNISAERMLEWTMKESLALVQAPNAKPEDKPTVPTKNFATGPEPLQLLAEYINENLEAMIILQDAWKHGVKQIPQRWPGRRVLLRHEIGPKKLYVAERELRAWLQDKDMSLREFMKDLESRQVVMGRKPTTLTAGTDFVSAPIPCIVVNTDHPAINGAFMADVATLERQAS